MHRSVALVTSVVLFAALDIAGIVRTYISVPIGDDWPGILMFYADALDGRWAAWFGQFMEHRPVLPRVLYWADVRYFGGRFAFLVAADFLLLCAIVAMLILYASRVVDEKQRLLIGAAVCLPMLSWMQATNLQRGFFGAQWFTAVLLPLLAFYALARTKEDARFFWLALAAGVASAGTMANGLFVLPILTAFAALVGLGCRRVACLAVASAVVALLYFSNFRLPGSSDPLAVLRDNPVEAIRYAFGYLGSPFYWIVLPPLAALAHVAQLLSFDTLGAARFARDAASIAAQLAGFLLAAASLAALRRWLTSEREPFRGALFAIVAFAGASAFSVALGRAGAIETLNRHEYTTVALAAWIALGLLFVSSARTPALRIAVACIFVFLLPVQLLALVGRADLPQRKLEAARALVCGSQDAPAPMLAELVHKAEDMDYYLYRLRGTQIAIFAKPSTLCVGKNPAPR